MTAITYMLLIAALILFAGLSLGSALLDRERKDEYLALVPILGVAGWITGLNFFFFITKNFAVSAYIVFAVFIVLAGRAIKRKQTPPMSAPALVALGVAFIFWVATLIPYILVGPGDYIGIFLGDELNYALEIDFFARHAPWGGGGDAYPQRSGIEIASALALYERGGFAIFAALPAWITGASGKAFVYPVSLLLSPLLFISAYAVLGRLRLGTAAIAVSLAALLFNNYYLFHVYGGYSSKALGIPMLLALVHVLYDGLADRSDKRSLLLSAVMSTALAVTYWEVAPIAILFYLGLVVFNIRRARLKPLIINSIIVLIITLLLAPNLYGIFTRGVFSKFRDSRAVEADPFWDSMQIEPYLLFATGLHGKFPTLDHNKDDGKSRMAPVDQWPEFWTELNRDYASEAWTALRWEGSEDFYLSWKLLLAMSVFFFIGLVAYDRKNAYFTAIGRFTVIGGALFLLTKPTGKVFYNFIFYLSPFVFMVWGTGFDTALRFIKDRAGRVSLLLLVLPLFYLVLTAVGAVYMTHGTGKGADKSALYTKAMGEYYHYLASLKGLGEFVRANASPGQRIVVMDKGPDAIKHAWRPLKYWLLYELKDYTALFFNPGGHFGGLKAAEGDKAGSWLVYMYRPYRVAELDAGEKSGIIFANEHFVISEKELPTMVAGYKQRPESAGTAKHFDGTGFLLYGAPIDLDVTGVRQYTLEIWLKPEKNGVTEGPLETYPPMPALIEPLALYQVADDTLRLVLKTSEGENLFYTVEGDPGSRWMHLAATVDRDKEQAIIFVNGERVERFRDVDVPLGANVVLGKGYLKRFWKGDMGVVRVSSIERYTSDFDPVLTNITQDKATLFLF